jgi:hypothetical protein
VRGLGALFPLCLLHLSSHRDGFGGIMRAGSWRVAPSWAEP